MASESLDRMSKNLYKLIEMTLKATPLMYQAKTKIKIDFETFFFLVFFSLIFTILFLIYYTLFVLYCIIRFCRLFCIQNFKRPNDHALLLQTSHSHRSLSTCELHNENRSVLSPCAHLSPSCDHSLLTLGVYRYISQV